MSARTLTGRDPQTGRPLALRMEDGTIARIEASSEETELYLAPGLVDLQVNGYAGFDVNAPQITEETVAGLADAMLAQGVTCFLPTIVTAPEETICRALRTIAAAKRTHARVASCVPFVHVEGPHISPLDGHRGAHDAAAVRPPSVAEFERWQQACDGLVGMVTLSPHFEGSSVYIAALVARGVHVAIGHTHASAQQIQNAVDAGARLSTHLGNGIALEIARHQNPVWPQLADDRLTATFIADGHHLPPDVLKAMVRAKGLERTVLVSDAVALAGMATGVYDTPVGGRVEMKPDGRLCVFGTEMLAGATASLAQGIGNFVRATGWHLHEALAAATSNPGRFAGGRGRLAPGQRADLVRFRWQDEVTIEDVWLAGEQVYTRAVAAQEVRRV